MRSKLQLVQDAAREPAHSSTVQDLRPAGSQSTDIDQATNSTAHAWVANPLRAGLSSCERCCAYRRVREVVRWVRIVTKRDRVVLTIVEYAECKTGRQLASLVWTKDEPGCRP